MQLNQLDPNALQIKTTETLSTNFYQIKGSEINWVKVQSKTGTTFNSDANSHRWTDLGIYSQSDIVKYNINKADGGLADTMLGDVYTAYNQTGMLVADIDATTFRASIHPNLRLTFPISGGTGSLSGLTSINLYTAFVEQNDSKISDGNGACSCWVVDTLLSESHPQSTYEAGIGYVRDGVNNPSSSTGGQYRSGVMHLFAEEIYYSGNTGTTWSDGWSGTSRYTFGDSPLAKFDGTTRNKSVGLIHLDSGLVNIYNPELVAAFNTSVATGGTITTGLTFSTSDCNMIIRDRDLTTTLEINTTLYPETFTKSTNPSLLDAKQAGIDCDDRVAITKICFYDEFGMLTATGLLDEPIYKGKSDFTLVKSSVSLDGGIKVSPETDGRTTYPVGL